MDVKKALEELKLQRLREARLWEKLNPDLALEALIKVMTMSGSHEMQVLMQYSYYLPPQLSEQIYLLGKLYELYHSGYIREPNFEEMLRQVKQNYLDKGSNPKKFPLILLLLLLLE